MADERSKINGAIEYLKRLGFSYNDNAQAIIEQCDQWYTNQADDFHKRTNLNGEEVEMESLNFAKRGCADDANLCEIVEINAGANTDKFDGVQEILDANNFDVMYREQLEKLSATGTVGAYIRLANADLMEDGRVRGGEIRINYVNAVGIIPLTIENKEIIDCAFVGYNVRNGKNEQTLVIFQRGDNMLYTAKTFVFDEHGKRIAEQELQLGDVKPFAIMRTAEVNNLDDMEGYGYPKLYSAIPVLKVLDLCWNILFGDLDKGEKILFINELLACVKTGRDGKPQLTKKQKELFILLGEKLPDQDSLIKEYNPEIRTTAIREALEIALSLFSMTFGYGTKKYSFEGGQIKTATEYIGERQDAMQELNKQRFQSTQYIEGLVEAIVWFSNTFQGTTWTLDEEICIEYDDSYIIDRQSKLDGLRADALSFPDVPEFLIQYIMMRLNCEREEAIGYIKNQPPEIDEPTD